MPVGSDRLVVLGSTPGMFLVRPRVCRQQSKCPVFLASEVSGFIVAPSSNRWGKFGGWGCRERGLFPFLCSPLY